MLDPVVIVGLCVCLAFWVFGMTLLWWMRRPHPVPQAVPSAGIGALAGVVHAAGEPLVAPVSNTAAIAWILRNKHDDGTTTTAAFDWSEMIELRLDGGRIVNLRLDEPQIDCGHQVTGPVVVEPTLTSRGPLGPFPRAEESVRIGDRVYVSGLFVRESADATEDPMRKTATDVADVWHVRKSSTGRPPLLHVGEHRDFRFGRRGWWAKYRLMFRMLGWMLLCCALAQVAFMAFGSGDESSQASP